MHRETLPRTRSPPSSASGSWPVHSSFFEFIKERICLLWIHELSDQIGGLDQFWFQPNGFYTLIDDRGSVCSML
jgi:hypothetical protein